MWAELLIRGPRYCTCLHEEAPPVSWCTYVPTSPLITHTQLGLPAAFPEIELGMRSMTWPTRAFQHARRKKKKTNSWSCAYIFCCVGSDYLRGVCLLFAFEKKYWLDQKTLHEIYFGSRVVGTNRRKHWGLSISSIVFCLLSASVSQLHRQNWVQSGVWKICRYIIWTRNRLQPQTTRIWPEAPQHEEYGCPIFAYVPDVCR